MAESTLGKRNGSEQQEQLCKVSEIFYFFPIKLLLILYIVRYEQRLCHKEPTKTKVMEYYNACKKALKTLFHCNDLVDKCVKIIADDKIKVFPADLKQKPVFAPFPEDLFSHLPIKTDIERYEKELTTFLEIGISIVENGKEFDDILSTLLENKPDVSHHLHNNASEPKHLFISCVFQEFRALFMELRQPIDHSELTPLSESKERLTNLAIDIEQYLDEEIQQWKLIKPLCQLSAGGGSSSSSSTSSLSTSSSSGGLQGEATTSLASGGASSSDAASAN
jgi:hypothetical protein